MDIAVQPIGYTSLNERKSSGSHYTPKDLSDFVADEILRYWHPTNDTVRIMDPALGDGELLLALAQKLNNRPNLKVQITGFDTDHYAIDTALARLKDIKGDIELSLENNDFLDYSLSQFTETLFSSARSNLVKQFGKIFFKTLMFSMYGI